MLKVAINKSGVISCMSNDATQLITHWQKHKRGLQQHPFLKIKVNNKDYQSIYWAPIANLRSSSLHERLYSLLSQVKERILSLINPESILHIILPPKQSERHAVINVEAIKHFLLDWPIDSKQLSFSYIEDGVCQTIYRLFSEDIVKTAIIIGVDSLVTKETINALMKKQKIMTQQLTEVSAPGEGIAYIKLTRKLDKNSTPIDLQTGQVKKLSTLIGNLTDNHQYDYLLLYKNQQPLLEEWHQICQNLWLRKKIKPYPVSFSLDHLIGDCGAAMFVMGLAFIHQYKKHQPNKKLAVCEINEHSNRGVVNL